MLPCTAYGANVLRARDGDGNIPGPPNRARRCPAFWRDLARGSPLHARWLEQPWAVRGHLAAPDYICMEKNNANER